MDKRYSKVILANMCMVYKDDYVLVQLRKKKDWPGLTFPGGHVENDETLEESVIREIKEETGLALNSVHFCGIKERKWESDSRYLGFLYKSNDFKGEIHSSKEGEVFWIKKEDIKNYPLSQDFEELFDIIDKN